MFNFLSTINVLEFLLVVNIVMWIVTGCLWGIDKLMKKPAYKIAWSDCGQIICFIDTVIFIFSFILYGIILTLGIALPDEILLIIFILMLIPAFIGGIMWKFQNK
ncbi:hypothetical protein ACQW5G_00870 [Fructilactobacillus sp. Tb1]|uniref:hypothetical protein n=1 Tax=Fructilactobacillus sp. Tb1 TaxID=3422304 RepID=UPI003D292762